jgi:hypothetical protein
MQTRVLAPPMCHFETVAGWCVGRFAFRALLGVLEQVLDPTEQSRSAPRPQWHEITKSSQPGVV